jgi:hypothetical protein
MFVIVIDPTNSPHSDALHNLSPLSIHKVVRLIYACCGFLCIALDKPPQLAYW